MECNKKTVRNKEYTTELYSYDNDKCSVVTVVKIHCKNFKTFEKLVKAITPILEDECNE